jgi:beta-N-acetylhexosaminidase
MSLRDLRQHVGQLAILGFPGHDITPELKSIAREFDLGGVIFFARNVSDPAQVLELSRRARELRRELPLWVSVDQEGGRVARLKDPFTAWPPMITLGRAPREQGEELARRFARALAAELKAVGINLDYAPVLDIHTNPKNPVIGDRALGERADQVGALGRAIIGALQGEGIAACGKHFPGHGDTSTDSHYELPLVEHPLDRLREVELVPFREAIAARVASIMTAHVLLPAIDEQRPATLSPAIVDALLKRELGFEGLVISDDLEMKAVSERYSPGEAAAGALAAGCDAFLVCGTDAARHVEALEGVIRAVEREELPLKRVEDALGRQRRVKERFLAKERAPDVGRLRDVLGRGEHRAIAEEMARFA